MPHSPRRLVRRPAPLVLLILSSAAGAQNAGVKPESLIPARSNTVKDALGFQWDFTPQGAVGDGNQDCFDNGLVLTVNGNNFNAGRLMMTADGGEFVATGQVGGINVTRRIRVDTVRGAARYLEVFENASPGAKDVPLNVEIQTTLGGSCQQVLTSAGTPFNSQLGKGEIGVFTVNSANSGGRPSALFIVADERGKVQPQVAVQNRRNITVTYNLTLKGRGPVSVMHLVAQRPPQGAGTAAAAFEPFYKNRRLVKPDVPSAQRKSVVNFRLAAGAVAEDEPETGPSLPSVRELAEGLNVERGRSDVLLLDDEARLTGDLTGEPLTVATPYGKTTVPLEEVAALTGGDGPGSAVRVYLRNGEILAGAVTAPKLELKTAAGLVVAIAAGGIHALFTRADPADGRPARGTAGLLQTQDGCRLAVSGDPPLTLDLATAWGTLKVGLDRLDRLACTEASRPCLRLILSDRTRLSVVFRGSELAPTTIRFGPLRIPTRDVAALIGPGAARAVPAQAESDEGEGDMDAWVREAYCRFAGSSVVAGVIDLPEIHLATDIGITPMDPKRILHLERVEGESGGTIFKVELMSGDTLSGTLRERMLPVRSADAVLQVPVRHLIAAHVPKAEKAAAPPVAAPVAVAGSIEADEAAAVAALRVMVGAELSWRQDDPDGDGVPTYWTADVFGLAFCARDTGAPIHAVPPAMANADRFPSGVPGRSEPRPFYVQDPPTEPVPYMGYLFEALLNDENGDPYAVDYTSGGKACGNAAKFGFRATPAKYKVTGVRTFQVNESGIVYAVDAAPGAGARPPRASWTGGEDPTQAKPAWKAVE